MFRVVKKSEASVRKIAENKIALNYITKEESYPDSFKEYQDKMYLPGYYVGSKIHPALKAKTKMGGYLMVIAGTFLLLFYLFQLLGNLSVESVGWIIPITFAVLLIIVGLNFIKINTHK